MALNHEALDNLMLWFHHRNIEPQEACWSAATLCGQLAASDERIDQLAKCMRETRKVIFAVPPHAKGMGLRRLGLHPFGPMGS